MAEKYTLVEKFNGYIRKQDITNVGPGFLVEGSQNVLTNEGERISVRKGFVKLETPVSVISGGIKSSFDWKTSGGGERHVRGWEARATVLSVTANTITKDGADSWASFGFTTTGNVWINGVAYAYTGGSATTTLTGVTPDPQANGVIAGNTALQGSLQFLDISVPNWFDLLNNRKQGLFNFTTVWDKTEYKRFLRMVCGENNNIEWSGGMATFKSATTTTITKQGSINWKNDSFYQYGTNNATINVINYTGLAGDTVAININGTTTTLTEGVDWNATSSNEATASSLASAINALAGVNATSKASVRSGTISVIDYTALTGDTVTITVQSTSGTAITTVLTEGVDWTAAVSNTATATSLATAIGTIANASAVSSGGSIVLSTIGTTYIFTDISLSNTIDMNSTPKNFSLSKITIDTDLGYSIRALTISDSTNMSRTPSVFVLKQVIIDGITYTYNGGETTTTLTGVTPDPTAGGHTAGDLIHQATRQWSNADIGIPATFNNDMVETFRNQLYIASNNANLVYISTAGNFNDFTFTTPVREVGEGDILTFVDSIRGLVPQDDTIYVFAGDDSIFSVQYTLSANLQSESIKVKQFNTAPLQGAITQSAIGKIKNSIVYVSNEKAFNQLGFIENVLPPQNVNISDPIKIEFETLDFTDASVFYFDYNILIALPNEDITLIFNLALGHWEAPQILPISRYSVINGSLYGHSSQIKQTYKMFTGYSDDGNPIAGVVLFSFNNFGMPANYKTFNEVYCEGYISGNTDMQLIINYEIDGCSTQQLFTLAGRNKRYVCAFGDDGSLGKKSFGTRSLAGRGKTQEDLRPPKFRWIPTMTHDDFYEVQFGFASNGVDQRWEILRVGPNAVVSDSLNVAKKD